MPESNAKYDLAGTKSSDFFRHHVSELKYRVKSQLPFWTEILFTTLTILLYFALSVGHPYYEEWLLGTVTLPLGTIVCYTFVKIILSTLIRYLLECRNGKKRVRLSQQNMVLSVIPPGIATGLYIGLSNRALHLYAPLLYLTTQSSVVIFVLGFALLFQLEKKSWNLTGIIVMISGGLTMFVYHPTRLNMFGIYLAILASFINGFRWTMVQHVMQKSNLGLESAIDVMYYIQPWVLISTIPIAVWFEGAEMYDSMLSKNWTVDTDTLLMTVIAFMYNSTIVFGFELSQFMIISRTSSLTLCIAGIFQMLCVLLLVDPVWENSLMMTDTNYLGLLICFAGIILYVIVRQWTTTNEEEEEFERNPNSDAYLSSDKTKIITINGTFDDKK